jgi:hypothetical protein
MNGLSKEQPLHWNDHLDTVSNISRAEVESYVSHILPVLDGLSLADIRVVLHHTEWVIQQAVPITVAPAIEALSAWAVDNESV